MAAGGARDIEVALGFARTDRAYQRAVNAVEHVTRIGVDPLGGIRGSLADEATISANYRATRLRPPILRFSSLS